MAVSSQPGELVRRELTIPDRYRIMRRIASGGMASVWCAHDAVLGRHVAIKILAEQLSHDPRAVRRFKREARVAARLSGHSHIVTIFDVGEAEPAETSANPRPFIVMEYLAGGTVGDALRVGTVQREDALRWLQQAASALDYAHGRGVIHRDIKPGNFLLDASRTLHVADFGIARIGTEDTITSAGQLLGTAGYLSPEQALGRPATEASDRYALAVAAFELLVGQRPFNAEHFAAQARQQIEDQPPRASRLAATLPRSIDTVLARGMAKRPEQRWASAAELVDALEASLGRRMTSPPIAVGSTATRPRALALAALASVALVLGVLAGAGRRSPAVRAHPAAHASRPAAARGHTQPLVAQSAATSAQAAAVTPPPTADTLEAQGHQLMVAGSYGAAVPVLRRAVAAASPASLTYAYALYDLGRSLRLGGDPRAAISILRQRLGIPNQTGTVRDELALALQAAGLRGPAVAPRRSHGHGDHGGGSGPGNGQDGGD